MKAFFSGASLVAGIALGVTGAAAADTIPMDPDGFTAYVANDFKLALPDYEVTITSPLTIVLVPSGSSGRIQANLDRMHEFCVQNVSDCGQELRGYVSNAIETLKQLDAPPDRAMLRAVVRPSAYVEELQKELGDAGAAEMAVESLTSDLMIICYLDFPTSMRPATAADFAKLGMTKEEAFDQAKKNVAMTLGSLDAAVKELPERGIGVLSGSLYESSWFALHDAWASVEARMDGELIVAVPAADKLLYAKRSDYSSVEALRVLAQQVARQSDRPISDSVYHWTTEGWELVAP